jgi:hypothetical protein
MKVGVNPARRRSAVATTAFEVGGAAKRSQIWKQEMMSKLAFWAEIPRILRGEGRVL